jgi:DegV family protein with EDD domain
MTYPIEIICDSTCDIPQNLIDFYGITVLPHVVIWGEQEYLDRVNIFPEEFYRRLETDPIKPTTSQVSVQAFAESYEKARQRGAKEIIVLTVSAAMSGAFQSAKNAAKLINMPVYVIDSKGPTMSLGWQVLAAARVREAGGAVQNILEKVEQVRKSLVQCVGLDTLEYLQRGGRIGSAARWIGGMLQIKPVVTINHETGLTEAGGVARTYKRMVDLLVEIFTQKLELNQVMHIAILHGNALDEAQLLAERICHEFSPAELLINITGPVLGLNTGPRALALCGYGEPA